jgi:hypothetical protein
MLECSAAERGERSEELDTVPYADNDGIRIHYEVEGVGPPLMLHHGFTISLEEWRRFGYVDALKSEYQVILIDARGHGASDKPHDPAAYEMARRAGDVVAVLDDLGSTRRTTSATRWGAASAMTLPSWRHTACARSSSADHIPSGRHRLAERRGRPANPDDAVPHLRG